MSRESDVHRRASTAAALFDNGKNQSILTANRVQANWLVGRVAVRGAPDSLRGKHQGMLDFARLSDVQSARAWLYGKLFVVLLTEQVMRYGRTLSPQPLPVALYARRSPWREFAFALPQLQQAIDSTCPLQAVMESWHSIIQTL